MPKEERGKTIAVVLSVASLAFVFDRLAKSLVLLKLSSGQTIAVLPSIFHITAVFNKAAAFGLFGDQRPFFIGISLFAVVLIFVYSFKYKGISAMLAVSLGLILGGALGNLADRIRLGYVIDFLDFRIWPVFNIADSCITIGGLLLGWKILNSRDEKARGKNVSGSI